MLAPTPIRPSTLPPAKELGRLQTLSSHPLPNEFADFYYSAVNLHRHTTFVNGGAGVPGRNFICLIRFYAKNRASVAPTAPDMAASYDVFILVAAALGGTARCPASVWWCGHPRRVRNNLDIMCQLPNRSTRWHPAPGRDARLTAAIAVPHIVGHRQRRHGDGPALVAAGERIVSPLRRDIGIPSVVDNETLVMPIAMICGFANSHSEYWS